MVGDFVYFRIVSADVNFSKTVLMSFIVHLKASVYVGVIVLSVLKR